MGLLSEDAVEVIDQIRREDGEDAGDAATALSIIIKCLRDRMENGDLEAGLIITRMVRLAMVGSPDAPPDSDSVARLNGMVREAGMYLAQVGHPVPDEVKALLAKKRGERQ